MSNNNTRILSQPISYEELLSIKNLKVTGIYKIENIVNHKVYIGQSKDIIKRLNEHIKFEENFHLDSAFKKYGLDNFSFEVIKQTVDLNYWEIFLIQLYRSNDRRYGYNKTKGGQAINNIEYWYASLSEAQQKRWKSEEERHKYSEVCKNQWNDSEIREKRVRAKIGHKTKEETKRKIGQTNREILLSKHCHWYNNGIESKLLSECPKGWKLGRINFKINNSNRILSEEQKKYLSDINKGIRIWNNGKVQIRSRTKPGEDFIIGYLNKKGFHWFTDGVKEICCENCPKGFKPGRIPRKMKKSYHFYNNGIINVKCEECPDGFVEGMLPRGPHSEEHKRKLSESHKGKSHNKGVHYYNNGIIEVMKYDCPEGFVPGRLNNKKRN